MRYPQLFSAIDRKIYYKKFQSACNRADKIIGISQQTKKDIIEFFGTDENKIEVKDQEVHDFISKADIETQNNLIAKIKEDKKYFNHIKNKLMEDAIIKLIVSKCKKDMVKKSFLEVIN